MWERQLVEGEKCKQLWILQDIPGSLPIDDWSTVQSTGRCCQHSNMGSMSVWDNGPPPTPESHFLIVFAGNSNYGEGYIEKVVIQKCQWTIHSGYIFGTFWLHMATIWLHFADMLATFCNFLATFWLHSGCILDTFCLHFADILATFCNVLATFWLHSGYFLATFWLHS